MRVGAWVSVITVCLLATGCSLFGKKSPNAQGPDGRNGTDRTAPAPPTPITPTAGRSTPPADLGGLLAGQVIDNLNRRPTASFIQVTELGAGAQPGAAPIEVAADSQGYFTIQGLKPGRHYQLTARAREGGRVLAGMSFATPPNPKLLIRISEDYATPGTPPVPGAPAVPAAPKTPPETKERPKSDKDQQTSLPGRDPEDNPTRGTASITTPRGAELGAPQGGSTAPTNTTPLPAAPRASVNPNVTSIPPQIAWAPTTTAPPVQPEASPAPAAPARVPSCDLTGRTLHNFALNDLTGQPWEYRRHRKGKLLLLDFWATNCVPCRNAIWWHLIPMQDKYGPYGLETIGISYESGTLPEQVRKVEEVRQRLRINYRLLLGSPAPTCPVRTQFGVTAFPTLVLLDENGRILWRTEGMTRNQVAELDAILQERLGLR